MTTSSSYRLPERFTSSTEFSSASKHHVEQYALHCWACEAAPLYRTDHAHVVVKTDRVSAISLEWTHWRPITNNDTMQFYLLNEMGIFDFQVSSATDNCLILCSMCHQGLEDHLNPAWIFYPSDLDYFINFELDDRKVRVSQPRSRYVPSSAMYLAHQKAASLVSDDAELPLYVPRVLAPEDSLQINNINDRARGWQGHPIAAIRSAWRCLAALRGNRVPLTDRARLAYLLDLYRTAPEEDVVPPPGLPPRPDAFSDHDSRDDAGKGKGKGKKAETGSKKRAPPQSKTRGTKRARGGRGAIEKGHQESVGELAKKLPTESTSVLRWLAEVENRTPPTTPSTRERA